MAYILGFHIYVWKPIYIYGFPGDSAVKNPPAGAGDTGLISE